MLTLVEAVELEPKLPWHLPSRHVAELAVLEAVVRMWGLQGLSSRHGAG